ncbi:MAG: class IV adenylate cyclase [Acidobacteria bacterium]|nr:MAG: class IV adenylate cyclase [Acidobacteriota bacterium]
MTEQVESEIKLRVDDPGAARRALSGLGAQPARERHFEDNTLYDDAQYSLFDGGRALRLRRAAGRALVTFKGPREDRADGVKSRPEIELEVADADAFESILTALGYRKVFRYQKYRETYAWRDVEIVLDETPIGTFLEIEGPVATIHAAATALGRGPADYIAESYAALFFASGGRGDMVFGE